MEILRKKHVSESRRREKRWCLPLSDERREGGAKGSKYRRLLPPRRRFSLLCHDYIFMPATFIFRRLFCRHIDASPPAACRRRYFIFCRFFFIHFAVAAFIFRCCSYIFIFIYRLWWYWYRHIILHHYWYFRAEGHIDRLRPSSPSSLLICSNTSWNTDITLLLPYIYYAMLFFILWYFSFSLYGITPSFSLHFCFFASFFIIL